MNMNSVTKLFTYGKLHKGVYPGLHNPTHYLVNLIGEPKNIRGLIKRMSKLSKKYISFKYECSTGWISPTQLDITFHTETRNQMYILLYVFSNVLKVCPVFTKFLICHTMSSSGNKVTYSLIKK